MHAVQCTHITKSFQSQQVMTWALRGVDLTVKKGEFMMLVGPSGCGKTTLISIIAGILHPDQGECQVQGHDYGHMTEGERLDFRAKHIGFIFQSLNLIPTLTVVENVMVPLIINQTDTVEATERAAAMLEKVGLGNRLYDPPNRLSGGEQQRIGIARSLIHNPSLLICDEPTGALDQATGIKILDLMRQINEESGTTFLVVTHDPRIYEYADRIAHMNDGRITDITQRTSFRQG